MNFFFILFGHLKQVNRKRLVISCIPSNIGSDAKQPSLSMQIHHIIRALTCNRPTVEICRHSKGHRNNFVSRKHWLSRNCLATSSNSTFIQKWMSSNWSTCYGTAAPITMHSSKSIKRTRNSRHALPRVSKNSASKWSCPIGEFNNYTKFIAHLNHVNGSAREITFSQWNLCLVTQFTIDNNRQRRQRGQPRQRWASFSRWRIRIPFQRRRRQINNETFRIWFRLVARVLAARSRAISSVNLISQ